MGSHQKRVAVIGAGVSGVTSAKHLKESGIEVVVFERPKQAGGNWTFDERKPLEPKYPSITPSIADFVADEAKTLNEGGGYTSEEEELRFAPPGPAYSGLTNNVSTKLQQLQGFPWPEGTEDFVNVRKKQEYIQSYSKHFGVEPLIRYNTRVEKLEKVRGRWKLASTTLIREGPNKGKHVNEIEEFDSVVVASGHYHSANVPDIPGLKEWKARWPNRVTHSKGYRRPIEFRDKTVLLVGAGVSSMDIGREVSHTAKKIYQSSRGGPFDIPETMLSPETHRVAGILAFEPPSKNQTTGGSVTFADGTVVNNVDRVVICTGYHFTLPFLVHLHDDRATVHEANDTVLITDGSQLHNLHKDIFYIPDPTLAFVGVPFYTATFSFFEFQAIAVAAVFSGRAWVPSKEDMQTEYADRLKRKGSGKLFHNLRGASIEYVDELVAWLNSNVEVTGGQKFEGYSQEWQEESKAIMAKYLALVQAKNTQLSN